MPSRREPTPPRPIAPGDIVTGFSESLGQWTAAQITYLDPDWKCAGVLDLDWSGPEPAAMPDVLGAEPVRRSYGSWRGSLSHTNHSWLLPRGVQVIGSLPLLVAKPSNSYGGLWDLGDSLARQRWFADSIEALPDLRLHLTAAELDAVMNQAEGSRSDERHLWVSDIVDLECGALVEHYPNLRTLSLEGALGNLRAASRLNELRSLTQIFLTNLFGMVSDDCLRPESLPDLEALCLENIPAEYAAATRSLWRREVARGTTLEVLGARAPEWVSENRTNPLRDWDGREHIGKRSYARSIDQYRATRKAILGVLYDSPCEKWSDSLVLIGRDFGERMNRISARTAFIETEERDELLDALALVFDDAEPAVAQDLSGVRDVLLHAVNDAREW